MDATPGNPKGLVRRALRATVVAFITAWAVSGNAAIIYQIGPNSISIPGLTGFATTGAMMDGLSVRAEFTGGLDETFLWADTGPQSGGVTGSGWGLSVDGDTFSSNWNFTISPNANLGQLSRLTLDGRDALTIFDRTSPSPGTDGSAAGIDWGCASAGLCDNAIVTYDYEVSIGAAPAVTDLYQMVIISFFLPPETPPDQPPAEQGPRVDFAFVQDTDNDSRLTQVPEPGTLVLLGGALAALGFARRKYVGRRA